MNHHFFTRTRMGSHQEKLHCVAYHGKSENEHRVIVFNECGNTMLDCSRWLFEQSWKRGYFTEVDGN